MGEKIVIDSIRVIEFLMLKKILPFKAFLRSKTISSLENYFEYYLS